LLEVCRYVVLNPVRASTIKHPRLYKWSSYGATAGTAQAHRCLTTEEILSHFGQRKLAAQEKYRDFVQDGIGSQSIWRQQAKVVIAYCLFI
jgi:putative transposase